MEDTSFVLLVPFRDAGNGAERDQLQILIAGLEKLLPPNGHLCIVEQSCDSRPFNRGQLANCGFQLLKSDRRPPHLSKLGVVVLHDVNVSPDASTLELYAGTSPDDPVRAFSAALHSYADLSGLGCAVAIRAEAFEAANGFPNNFWDGGEDSAFRNRLRKAGIAYTQHGGVYTSLDNDQTIIQPERTGGTRNVQESSSSLSLGKVRQLLATDKTRWKGDGLSTVEFSVKEQQVLKRCGEVWGGHFVVQLEAEGVRCGRCQVWRPLSCYSSVQAFQRGPAEKSVCKLCLEPEYAAIEVNLARNEDQARRSCSECNAVFATRSQLFKHLPTCGTTAEPPVCAPCAPPTAAPQRRAVSPQRAAYALEFSTRLKSAAEALLTGDARALSASSEAVIRRLVASQALTFQSKSTNVVQLKSLLACVEPLVLEKMCVLLELGAGKALLTRAAYETFERRVPVVALDNRAVSTADPFYDPIDVAANEAPYTRVVANVQDEGWSERKELQGPVIALTKHLCGGATDASLVRVCHGLQLEGLCMAPCCHQKLVFKEYCNPQYLESVGFGGEKDFKFLLLLIQISKHDHLKENEYRNRAIVQVLPFSEIKALGRMARRLLEEGRVRYLRDRGFAVEVCRYVADDVTPDNLVILAKHSAPK